MGDDLLDAFLRFRPERFVADREGLVDEQDPRLDGRGDGEVQASPHP